MVIDQVDGKWQDQGYCGIEYGKILENSKKQFQEIDFFDYKFTVEIRSANDPNLIFKHLTLNTLKLDGDPVKEKIAGVILLLFAILFALISGLKLI